MDFDTIVSRVMNRLNLTSPDARNRVGDAVNDRYKQVTSSVGVNTSRTTVVPLTVDPQDTVNFPDLPEVTITTLEKISKIVLLALTGSILLKEVTYDELSNIPTAAATPEMWGVKRMGAHEVTFVFNAVPAMEEFTINITGYEIADELVSTMEPFFPEDFHDILVHGAMSDELRKMEKAALAAIAEKKFEDRLGDLRMFIAKSAYLDIAQGKNKPTSLWYRPWYSRVTIS